MTIKYNIFAQNNLDEDVQMRLALTVLSKMEKLCRRRKNVTLFYGSLLISFFLCTVSLDVVVEMF